MQIPAFIQFFKKLHLLFQLTTKTEAINEFEREKNNCKSGKLEFLPKFIAYDCFKDSYFIDYIQNK